MELILYSRRGCHLCEEAREVIEAVARERGDLPWREVDIDDDAALRKLYTNDVPVVVIDGHEVMRHRVGRTGLAQWLDGRLKKRVGHGRAVPNPKGETSMEGLAKESCVPCRGGVPPLRGQELAALARELGGEWRVENEHHLEREFRFKDFREALSFTNRVGEIAEAEGHHPDIYLAWGKVRITIWTHKIDGLTRSDFVLAAKIDQKVPST